MRVRYVDARFTPPPERCMECGGRLGDVRGGRDGDLCDRCAPHCRECGAVLAGSDARWGDCSACVERDRQEREAEERWSVELMPGEGYVVSRYESEPVIVVRPRAHAAHAVLDAEVIASVLPEALAAYLTYCRECGALIRRSEGTLCDGCAAAEEALPC